MESSHTFIHLLSSPWTLPSSDLDGPERTTYDHHRIHSLHPCHSAVHIQRDSPEWNRRCILDPDNPWWRDGLSLDSHSTQSDYVHHRSCASRNLANDSRDDHVSDRIRSSPSCNVWSMDERWPHIGNMFPEHANDCHDAPMS